jgi:hypothetical protein
LIVGQVFGFVNQPSHGNGIRSNAEAGISEQEKGCGERGAASCPAQR